MPPGTDIITSIITEQNSEKKLKNSMAVHGTNESHPITTRKLLTSKLFALRPYGTIDAYTPNGLIISASNTVRRLNTIVYAL